MRRGDGDHDASLADRDAPDAVVDRDVAELVARLQLLGDLGHDLLGHALVGLVLEVRDGAAARVDARRADERRDRAGLVRCDLVDDGFEREGLVAEEERAAGDRRDQRDLVPVGQLVAALDVRLVHGVDEPARLVAEVERRPHVVDARDVFDVALRPARALAQAGEQPHVDSHRPTA